jgi:hypothetical protein
VDNESQCQECGEDGDGKEDATVLPVVVVARAEKARTERFGD